LAFTSRFTLSTTSKNTCANTDRIQVNSTTHVRKGFNALISLCTNPASIC
jgi:hypothetical protein